MGKTVDKCKIILYCRYIPEFGYIYFVYFGGTILTIPFNEVSTPDGAA